MFMCTSTNPWRVPGLLHQHKCGLGQTRHVQRRSVWPRCQAHDLSRWAISTNYVPDIWVKRFENFGPASLLRIIRDVFVSTDVIICLTPFISMISVFITLQCARYATLRSLFNDSSSPANTTHLYNICTILGQRRRRWTDVVQMLYICFCVCWSCIECSPKLFVCIENTFIVLLHLLITRQTRYNETINVIIMWSLWLNSWNYFKMPL